MSFTLVFKNGVRQEIDAIYEWHENEREGLGLEFLDELERVLDRLSEQPLVHRKIRNEVRRALLKKFPYSIYYRVPPTRVEVIAVLYSRRDPAIWQARADED
jgi:plasmid stabilization system protein ParE